MKRLIEIADATHAVVPRKVTPEIVRAWNGGDPYSSLPASAAVECQADWDRMIAAAPAVPDARVVTDERAAFEAWMALDFPYAPLYRRDMAGSERIGEYCATSIQEMWLAWQGRAPLTSPAPAVPDAQTIVAERDKWKADYFAADKLRTENYETIKRLQAELAEARIQAKEIQS